jgi:hypothetical protein
MAAGAAGAAGAASGGDSGGDSGEPNPPPTTPTTPTTQTVRVRIVAQSADRVAYLLAKAPETRIEASPASPASPATAQADRTPIRPWVFAWDERVAALVPPFEAYHRQALLSQVFAPVSFFFRSFSFLASIASHAQFLRRKLRGKNPS